MGVVIYSEELLGHARERGERQKEVSRKDRTNVTEMSHPESKRGKVAQGGNSQAVSLVTLVPTTNKFQTSTVNEVRRPIRGVGETTARKTNRRARIFRRMCRATRHIHACDRPRLSKTFDSFTPVGEKISYRRKISA